MTVKIIGALLITLSALTASISHGRFQKRRLLTVDGFISLLAYIKGRIDCYALPLSEILSSLSLNILYDCNCPEGAETLDEMINNSRIYLDEESERLLDSFSLEFGSIFREEQLRRCDYYIEALTEQRGKVYEDVKKRSRVGSALLICSSLGLLILLL